ncbi:MAG TPA: hypothetical protein VLA12_18320, partial [Planctomycetaceae bacterium]|nr:hypothetical protein [Planctomycetaceae bacterium]
IIRRLNEDISDVEDRGAADRQAVAALQRKGRQLINQLPAIQEYRIGNLNNVGQFEKLSAEIETAISALGADDTVTADEVAAFNAARDQIVERIEGIFIFVSPDIADGKDVQKLKADLDTFRSFTAVEGTLSGDNADLTTSLNSLLTRSNIALTTTENNVTTAFDLEEAFNSKLAGIESEVTELSTLDFTRKQAEIESLQIDAANLLTAISLSFEANDNFSQAFTDRLRTQTPEPGSVLNLFT